MFRAAGFIGFAVSSFALGHRAINERTAPGRNHCWGETEARFAPLPDSTVHFRLAEGTKVAIREDRDQWLFVERADGQQGWVKHGCSGTSLAAGRLNLFLNRGCGIIVALQAGGVAEWSNAAVLKTVRLARVSGVRIPPPPPTPE